MTTPSKIHLRRLARATLAKISPEDLRLRSASLLHHASEFLPTQYPEARRIAVFAAMPHEPDLSLLHALNPKLDLCYPLVLNREEITFHLVSDPSTLLIGTYGIPEPVPQQHPPILAEDLDLILVPGIAFDLFGNRLGQGAGYYDRFLKKIPQTPRVGITFSSQILPQVPTEAHDLSVQTLLSDHGPREAQSI